MSYTNYQTSRQQARREFTFLADQNSSDYILAKAKVEETCDNLKIKTSLHEMAEMRVDMRRFGRYLYGLEAAEYEELLGLFVAIDRRADLPEKSDDSEMWLIDFDS